MTSQLASQLQRLQQRPDGSQHRLAKSFLFSTQDAQSFSREQIHQLALNGLQALTAMDNRFHPFIQDLFDVKRVRQERSMLTTTEDSTLRVRLEHFLTLLSPHLFLTAAQQVLEFLVRVYEVHIYDVASVLRAFLPYHDHNIFARALLLLDLRDTGFDFLATNQLRGAPLLREHLVLACAESRKAARLVCLTVAMPFRYEIRHHAANALFASVVTQLTTHKDAEALWRTFLPFVLELLSGAVSGAEAGTEESKRARQSDNARGGSSRVSTESVATALVVLAAWSAHVRFSKAMLITMLKPIFRYTTAAAFAATGEGHHGAGVSYLPVRDLLALLEIVLATQHHALSDVSVAPLLQTLLTLPWRTLASQLPFAETTMMVAGPNGAPTTSPRHSALLATLLQTALERLSSVSEARLLPSEVVEFLTCAAEDLPLSNYMVTRYLRVLMTAEAGASPAGAVADTPARAAEGASNQSLYYRLAVALERRYAIVFDGVLSEVLLHPETTAAATAFLARHFRGTRYGMVEVGSTLSGATETLPLFACLLHPVPEVRALAAKTLQGMPTAQLISDASTASGSGQSLVDLLAHVISYERNCTAAEAFVATAAAVMERLAARWSSEKSMGRDELGCRAACQLVRSVYSMVLAWSPSVASAAPASVAARAEAQRRVVLPLVTTLLRPALLTWTRGAGAMSSAAQDFRTSVLYHATLLYAQWAGTPSAAMQTPGEDVALAAQVASGLVATLEAGCGGPDALAPLFRARSSSDKEQDKKTARNGSSGKRERQRVGRRCIASAESDSDDSKEQQQSQAGSSGRNGCIVTGARIAWFTDLIQCDALLDSIRTEAQRRLPDAFAAARTAAREAATDLSSAASCEVEVAVALAAALLPAIGTEVPANVLETVSAVVIFLHGGNAANDAAASETAMASSATSAAADGGYLDVAYATFLDNGSERRVAQVGRGTVDAATAAREQLYEAPLVARVGAVLRAALTRVLARAATAAAASVSSWAPLVLQLCQGLGFVGAALPSIAAQPDVLAPAYLELISSMTAVATTAEVTSAAAALRQVDWYALVADAVFSSAEQSEVNDAPYAKPMTLAALALVLFLPLRAPSTQRLAQLRALQDTVVTAGAQHGSTRGGANRLTGEQVIVASAMQLQQGTSSSTSTSACTVTALSCLIECMAVEERKYQLTPSAAALVCSLLNMQNGTDGGAQAYVVPVGWAHRVVRYFFRSHNSHGGERARAGSSAAAAAVLSPAEITPQQVCLIEAMLPRVEGILTSIENVDATSPSSSTRTATADAADLVDAVCSRLRLWGSASAKEDAVTGNASVRLVELLLKHPYVHVHHGGGARPVYRYALAALAVGLSYGLEDRQSTQSTVFKSRKSASTAASRKGEYALSAEYQRLVAARLQPVVLHAIDVIGTDVALACMGTLGGYEYFFLPLVASVESATASAGGHSLVTSKAKTAHGWPSQAMSTGRETASEAVAVLLKRVHEMLETLAPSTAAAADETPSAKHNGVTERAAEGEDGAASAASAPEARWRPPASAAVANPLTFADARRVLRLPSVCAAAAGGTGKWPLGALSHESLRLLRTLLRVLPTVAMDEEEDGESIFALVMECVELYPLQGMEVLLRHAASSAVSDDVAMLPRVQQLRLGARGSLQVEGVLRFVEALVHVCTDQTRLLSEKVTDGAHRIKSLLLREMMVLMARLLVDDLREDDGAEKDEEASAASLRRSEVATDATEWRQSELHFHVDTIAGLLRATEPLLKVPTATAAAAVTARTSVAESSTCLHIPLVSLLIKLEPFDHTEALGFRSAREVCQEILSSFDVRTQVECLGQLMRLVADPAAQLSSGANAGEDGEEQQRVQHLFRRMVKPNQVINRQEAIMHLVNLTVKSDLFLEPFLALQRHARSSQPSRAAERRRRQQQQQRGERSTGADKADGKESDADEEAEEQAEGAPQREDGGCMGLLVSALELFAHYHDLHETTRSSAASESADAEAEAYTSLLELLAGNTLACVLAGINEPTFVVCQQRLLEDERAALRKVGLEVLLDRLHHSLPTLENVVSDEEMEAHRRRLRDPRQRLSLVDLVRIKARPLTTKRSIQLFPLLVAEIKCSLAQFHAAAQSTNAAGELLITAQLGIAAVEELIRIVSSGGSLQSEKTLLNANRSKRVTEAALVKLFGNRSRVAAVHELVDLICNHWMPLLTRCEMRLRSRAEQPGTDGGAYDSTAASRSGAEENVLGCMTCLVTALATITQVMGTAFASTHCLHLLHTLVSAGVYQVLEMPGVVSRSEAGALLRHSTLSSMIRCFPACWQMTQPYLPSMLFLATHLRNVTDAESHYLCAEMLAVLEAVMEPQLLLDAGRACLQGLPYLNGAVVPASEQHQLTNLAAEAAASASEPGKAKKGTVRVRQIRAQVHTHSFALLFTCFERRVENMSKEELLHMRTLTEGTTPQQNFWLAAFQSLASAPSVPSSEAVMPALQAFTVFLLKFKAKHSVRLLRIVADWAFAESSGGVAGASRKHAAGPGDSANTAAEEEHNGRGHDGAAQSISRVTLQSWIVFFALSNHLLGKLGSILDFAFPIFLPHVVTALRTYCAATATASKSMSSLVALALEGALECMRNMALAQTPGPDHDYSIQVDVYFAKADVFPSVMPALVHQLHNLHYLEDSQRDYRFRVEHNVIPAIRAFMACLGSSKLQSRTQAEVVRALRHPSRHVRREALICLDGIYADGGDELASRLMAEMLPTVVELTEDRDDTVVEEARKLCNNLSHMTGQDVLYAMS
ncbi:conserved hypothetical protein [Leishmania infantum JPCM5]|uniref:HEAT repeat-containing protein 1 n=2 Tax=Leishmania infantum TaxID=5671 RepID=A0A6L0XSD2_LEIIN|nr:conserved hypothetical protein [Leishmania infantum JPCM5]CAC9497170.1 hypothetical_protein_-_conserved [Leishmania infantum]CAM68901.1 conserved hypothetical protein [Leishmania infantum JPCM5]SUZ42772.1 hypothetical_protein_-_conserved [Leishmania infantum]|eukprot:XP_001470523.1 conserved hypothetical protein [Leishmania infantum JPCM5]